jgi:hypothetical protein
MMESARDWSGSLGRRPAVVVSSYLGRFGLFWALRAILSMGHRRLL